MNKPLYNLDYEELVTLGNLPQNIRVRGTTAENPLLLFLHGGPGGSDRHWVLKDQSGLADVCTLVCWDQRGSGKSYSKAATKEKLTIDLMVNDAVELVEYLCAKFNKEKLYVVGHSWGSILGVMLAQRKPDRIAAYVGMGQVIDLDENERLAYKFVLDEANKRGDKKAIKALEAMGEPVEGSYGSFKNLLTQRNLMTKYGGGSYNHHDDIFSSVLFPLIGSPEYGFFKMFRYLKGTIFSVKQLVDEMASSVRLSRTAATLDVPVYITQGDQDQNAPTSVALKWFDALEAPHKEWIAFAESAHSPIKEEPELWGNIIREKLFS